MRKWKGAIVPAVMLALAGVAACGDDDDNGSTPTGPSGGGNVAATITITASGASPRTVTVPVGSRVMFVNNDSRDHEMNSDPHPDHSACPPLNDVGFLAPGQSRATGNLTTARTCGFHDHNLPSDTSLQGSIVIQ